ncbi:MAG TPA: Holliday junction branch migration protein RuvA, partial [Thermoanaerobaculia bacterium]|nr:Holliday junction branch migration protein RuvA [Thermoanaerobaculia bacterium]
MIGRLRGKVVASDPERVILEVAGIGFDVQVSLNTFYEVERAARDDEKISLFVHTHVREDALELYGFWSEREKSLFARLIAVSGIGPRLARSILSGMAPDDLIVALAAGDIARLSRTPGVG